MDIRPNPARNLAEKDWERMSDACADKPEFLPVIQRFRAANNRPTRVCDLFVGDKRTSPESRLNDFFARKKIPFRVRVIRTGEVPKGRSERLLTIAHFLGEAVKGEPKEVGVAAEPLINAPNKKEELLEIAFRLFEEAAFENRRCPSSETIRDLMVTHGGTATMDVTKELARRGKIIVYLYSNSWRAVKILSGQHAGLWTLKPQKAKPYAGFDTRGRISFLRHRKRRT